MGLAGFLRKLQDIYTTHKLISTIFLCFLIIPPTYFYSFYVWGHLSNVFLTNSKDLNSFVGATFRYVSFIAQVEAFTVLGISMFSLQMPIYYILASQKKVDSEAELSIKSLILILTKPARSLLVTWFLVRIIKLAYIFFGLLVLHRHMELITNSSCEQQHDLSQVLASNIGTMIFVAGGVLIFAYVATFGNLAIDISVREEIGGTRALKKASEVLEGKRKLIGFLVNLVLGVISVWLFEGYVYLNTCSKVSVESKRFMLMNIWHYGIYQVEFYTWISFSFMYSMWKKDRGEVKFQPQGSLKRILMEEEEEEEEEKEPLI
ncbi:unnamed protein product [Sphenostylis stenocarpa]|uniref:Uncharacterized protein n=1 Tax=Sphenostylis stenocarpa TaxID=92480 RepID=A0AA86SJE4_9FABA|nr:unnamed protein product [Sphenostylis stenocarpa]